MRGMVLGHIILLLVFAVTNRVRSQLDSHGFLSIDCGFSVDPSYVDPGTNLTYVSDELFIDTGVNSQVSSNTSNLLLSRELETVRNFPTGIRNCYTLRSLTVGSRYLIRAAFYYGNYDKLNKPPTFDIYLGVNFWATVKDYPFYPEIIISATMDYLHVCLVNTNHENPFISSLHLRKVSSILYKFANATQSLISVRRSSFGGSKFFTFLRYPDDMYDRWWWTETLKGTIEISTNFTIEADNDFEIPSLVKQTAATTLNTQQPLSIYWNNDDKSTKYYFILHGYEIQPSMTGRRKLDIVINRIKVFDEPFILRSWYWVTIWRTGFTNYNVSVVASFNSTLPPLLNGFELYKIAPVLVTTNGDDVAAINSVKKYHNITKNWIGDPCLPTHIRWDGIDCTTDLSNIKRITGLNLSSSFLAGPLSDSIGNLTGLEYLYLSYNDLSGSLPSSLDNLTSLKFLDIRGNPNISTTLSQELQNRQRNKSLEYRFDDNMIPSHPPSLTKNVIIIASAVGVPVLIIGVAIATFLWLKRRKYNRAIAPKGNESYELKSLPNDHANNYAIIPHGENPNGGPQLKGAEQIFRNFENRKFSYNDLKKITNGFKNNIGTGGFGSVYSGNLENGRQVAVKMLSISSRQGKKEFLAEAENLTRARHKNLVLLMGYCIDENCIALVYEYMQKGSLRDRLKDNEMPLSWNQRLQIAYESALGLEYLHKACSPPLIHRDVKTSNILLNANLEAKIADFGLSKAFDSDAMSHVSTDVVGTPGYLDPEYYISHLLRAKSDVFSFGVVLLEMITGRPPTSAGLEGGNLPRWVHQKLSGGDIESIVDPQMEGNYDINSVWKVTDLACRCTEFSSSERPTMAVVAAELKESLDLEMSMEEIYMKSTENILTDVSQDSGPSLR